MQAFDDIFLIWESVAEMARDIQIPADRIRKWRKSGRIPSEAWAAVLAGAERKGAPLAAEDLMRLNKPSMPPGKASPKYGRNNQRRASGNSQRRRTRQSALGAVVR